MKKSILAIVLAIVMVAGLVGCGGGSSTPETSTGEAAADVAAGGGDLKVEPLNLLTPGIPAKRRP